ncbi:MAG: ABC transporter permease [Bacteroidota bacterium]
MRLLIRIAWRNIFRNKRRSLLTIAAIAFAVFLSVWMRGLQLGTYQQNIKNYVGIFTGYMQIRPEGYTDKPSLRKSFKFDDDIKSLLDSLPHVQGYAPRISTYGLIARDDKTFGAAILAVDPELEKSVSQIDDRLHEGQYLSDERIFDVVTGYKLLENLDASIGDTVVILSSAYDGSMGNIKFRIAGTSKTGMSELDNMSVFMNIKAAKQLLYMSKVNMAALRLEGLGAIPEVQRALRDKLPEGLIVEDWAELLPSLKQSLEFDEVSGLIFVAILIIVVGFGILNTVLMSVTERFKEFGIMLAVGMNQWRLLGIVLFEVVFMAFLGIISGSILGWLGNYIVSKNPIYFGGETAELMEQFGFEPAMYAINDPGIFINYTLIVLITSFAAFIYPAVKLMNLEPLKGIRYT